ncbi:Archaemetzincin-2 [Dactylellina cionopaga]|nr:Archaemetzincin-2 [Dactylellina cionopaga]
MPPKKRCQHSSLQLTCSPNAEAVGFAQPPPQTLFKATTTSTRQNFVASSLPALTTFPAPLILPGDDLSYDPKYPTQSLLSWKRLKERNPVTQRRSKIYHLSLPVLSSEATEFQSWSVPIDPDTKSQIPVNTAGPEWTDVVSYLTAFFSPLEVVEYPSVTRISRWPASSKSRDRSLAISTSSSQSYVQLRFRPTPDGPESCFSHQLNLLDILDFAIEIVPDDAYALIIYTNHDLYEDDDDDFCVGRAFGGSRVCVVSSARYHPFSEELAGVHEMGVGHDWPGSHCKEFVEQMCAEEGSKKKTRKIAKVKTGQASGTGSDMTPMQRALVAHAADHTGVKHSEHARTIWLSRLCKTASHELLHCFGLDHCVYYACAMQGTASIVEDTRQPFYLCPVDQAKLKEAIAGKDHDVRDMGKVAWELGWCKRMKVVCDAVIERDISVGWRGIVGWLDGRIAELEREGTADAPIEVDD